MQLQGIHQRPAAFLFQEKYFEFESLALKKSLKTQTGHIRQLLLPAGLWVCVAEGEGGEGGRRAFRGWGKPWSLGVRSPGTVRQAVHRTEMQAAGQAGAKTGMSKENLLSLGPTSPEF